jgi:anhydro-N-acetylmuramic acid kinase
MAAGVSTAKLRRAIGLMSGTSLDGIDAAFIVTDGRAHVETGPWLTIPYPAGLRERLRAVLGGVGAVAEVEREITEAHADAVTELRRRHSIGTVDVIGFHGHTILHQPEKGRTWQIGDGALLARRTGFDVVCDFRSADVAAGGEGAPLVPLFHAALTSGFERPLAVLNIGGVANVTWIGADGAVLAFDTGPGNALIDDWCLAHTGKPVDEDGRLAATGAADAAHLARFLGHGFFARKPPKSLDRDEWGAFRPSHLGAADGAATLTAMTAAAASSSRQGEGL